MLVVLLLALFTPLVAAAAQAAQPGPVGGILPIATVVGLAGLGAVISLRAKDASGNKKSFAVQAEDGKESEAMDSIEAYGDLRADAAAAPLESALERLKAETNQLREILAAEIIRVKKLTAPTSEGGEADFDVEQERLYLLGNDETPGLPVSRLKVEYEKAVQEAQELSVDPKTDGSPPQDETSWAEFK